MSLDPCAFVFEVGQRHLLTGTGGFGFQPTSTQKKETN